MVARAGVQPATFALGVGSKARGLHERECGGDDSDTVQDILAPPIKTQGARLDGFERRLDDVKSSLEHRIDDSKELLRAEIRASEARLDGRFGIIEGRLGTLGALIRGLIQQLSVEMVLRERIAAIEARLPTQ